MGDDQRKGKSPSWEARYRHGPMWDQACCIFTDSKKYKKNTKNTKKYKSKILAWAYVGSSLLHLHRFKKIQKNTKNTKKYKNIQKNTKKYKKIKKYKKYKS